MWGILKPSIYCTGQRSMKRRTLLKEISWDTVAGEWLSLKEESGAAGDGLVEL